MARLGEKRADAVLDYERDIKGKGLVRLRAGVGAGKNYWVRHLLEKNPNLRILMITSRKNTAAAEAHKLGIDNKIHISKLDLEDRDLCPDSGTLMVVTNSYIEHFFMKLYDAEKESTHLWKAFDVIFVDEAHSLTDDAAFADSAFYVERLIYHTRKLNPSCDVVLMSGTMEPLDWILDNEPYKDYVDLDIYDECVHLVPDTISLMQRSVVPDRIYDVWKDGERVIYFANSVRNMAKIINKLCDKGIPLDDLGVAYTKSDNENQLPEQLVSERNLLRRTIVSTSKVPDKVKILFTTSQNKEGISIENDDIKYMFVESHKKSDLEQMAGRVRGNPETGTGIHMLCVVTNAPKYRGQQNYIDRECDRILADSINDIVAKHKSLRENAGKKYSISEDIALIREQHRYLRYDYISKQFCFYAARAESEQQQYTDDAWFTTYYDLYEENLGGDVIEADGKWFAYTGRYVFSREWFPYSNVYRAPDAKGAKEQQKILLAYEQGKKRTEATASFIAFLQQHNLIEMEINEELQKMVINEVHCLIDQYGVTTLGFTTERPKSLKPILERFGLTCEDTSNHKNKNKIIHYAQDVGIFSGV